MNNSRRLRGDLAEIEHVTLFVRCNRALSPRYHSEIRLAHRLQQSLDGGRVCVPGRPVRRLADLFSPVATGASVATCDNRIPSLTDWRLARGLRTHTQSVG